MSVELPDPNEVRPKSYRKLTLAAGAILLVVGGLLVGSLLSSNDSPNQETYLQCNQTEALIPDFKGEGVANSSRFLTEDYEKLSIELLSGAIRIPTVSYDDMDMDVTKEPRFEIFYKLHDYLFHHFPLLSKHVEKINTYGLLYTIQGSDPSLKPALYMAHQDVVPVAPETADKWEHDPFSGDFDGEWIHGRGTSDTKNSLIAMHEAVEALLEQNWRPKRTLLMSFGFDEEIQGWRGARKLAEHIESVYGPDSIEILLDEGFGLTTEYGVNFASPAVAEKGRINFKVTLNTPGGHSSAPPDHTGIGMMSELVTLLEADAPLTPSLPSAQDAVRGRFSCIGRYGDDVPSSLREVFTGLGSPIYDSQLVDLLAGDIETRILVETTQAIDIIHGGVKVNALPEQVILEVNYRVKPASSLEIETERFLTTIKEVASRFELGAKFQDTFAGGSVHELVPPQPAGSMFIEVTDSLAVAPVSPFYNSSHWDTISGTTKHVFEDVIGDEFGNAPLVVTPQLMTGNTDTAHYWNLTHNIYRYMPVKLDTDARNIHTVNEGLRPRSHIASVVFYYEFLLNVQQQLS